MTIKKYYPYLIFILIYSMIVGGAVFYINGKPFVILADDEMISMWYARTLNCTTEGYSNPLWTLFMIPCNLLPQNLACLPVTILNGACIIGIMKLSNNPVLVALCFPLIFWGICGFEFIPIALLMLYAVKKDSYLIPIILITFLRIDGFIFAGILIFYKYIQL